MFEFGRDLKRLFGVDAGAESKAASHREGLTGGDTSLLELLDVRLLTNEARSADVAAGRIGAKDRGSRLLEAAVVWRELARRSGDATALRKAASHAEAAANSSNPSAVSTPWPPPVANRPLSGYSGRRPVRRRGPERRRRRGSDPGAHRAEPALRPGHGPDRRASTAARVWWRTISIAPSRRCRLMKRR
jgi:hypothetical protein